MTQAPYRKIIIIGRAGSGKSTLATLLVKRLALPAHHLDKYFFVDHWREQDSSVFMAHQSRLVEEPFWIIDGNALHTLEMRYSQADLIFVLNYPLMMCLMRVIKRRFFKNTSIDDRAPNCPERIQWKLIWYIIEFPRRLKYVLSPLIQQYPDKRILYFEREKDLVWFLKKERI